MQIDQHRFSGNPEKCDAERIHQSISIRSMHHNRTASPDKFLLQLESQLADKKVDVTFTDKLRKHLAKKGFDPLMGARPMQRLIQDTNRRALADELLFGRLTDGGRLTVDLDDKDESKTEVLLDIQPLPKKEGRSKPEPQEATAG